MARCEDGGDDPVEAGDGAADEADDEADDGAGDGLAAFAATARIEDAIGARRRERWLRQQAGEEVSLLGTCWSLAEAGRAVAVTTRAGTSHRGRLRVVGDDFVALVDDQRREHVVPLAGLVTLRAASPGRSRQDGPAGRPLRSGARLAEALASLAGERPLVALTCDGRDGVLRGELLGAGADVVVVGAAEGPTQPRSAIYVRLSAVAELSLMASG